MVIPEADTFAAFLFYPFFFFIIGVDKYQTFLLFSCSSLFLSFGFSV